MGHGPRTRTRGAASCLQRRTVAGVAGMAVSSTRLRLAQGMPGDVAERSVHGLRGASERDGARRLRAAVQASEAQRPQGLDLRTKRAVGDLDAGVDRGGAVEMSERRLEVALGHQHASLRPLDLRPARARLRRAGCALELGVRFAGGLRARSMFPSPSRASTSVA